MRFTLFLLGATTLVGAAAAAFRRALFSRGRQIRLCAAGPALPSGSLDASVDRKNTWSRKMQGRDGAFGDRDIIPLWVADMDFRSPQPIVDALVARAANGVYGYTDCPAQLEELVFERLKSVHGLTAMEPTSAWFRWLPGLLSGLHHAARAACGTTTGQTIAIPTPIYKPFLDTPGHQGQELAPVPLKEVRRAGGELHFEVDWARLEAALAAPSCRILQWCNPHNPTGRCWTVEENKRVAQLCVTHDVILCSDEVWGEVPLEPDTHPFVSMLSLLGDVRGLADRLIVLISPSKCFNVAPLDLALAIAPNPTLLAKVREAGKDSAEVSCFGYTAAVAAYEHPECEAWRRRLVRYLAANRDYAAERLRALGIRCVTPEASYLMWMDCAEADGFPPGADAHDFFLNAGVALTGGVPFAGAPGTARLNFGCRRETLEAGLDRMAAALGR